MAQSQQAARSWNPKYTHDERERWACIYPVYINSRRTVAEGRKVPKNKAVDNPSVMEIKDVLAHAGLVIGVENKVHPRERDPKDPKCRGRIRVNIKNADGTPKHEKLQTRMDILRYLGETIPKLKTRQGGSGGQGSGGQKSSGQGSSQGSSQQQQSSSKKKKGKKK